MVSAHYNLSPQGDGNVFHAPANILSEGITTYPRKGTVTDCHKFSGRRYADYNFSPQGDGNRIFSSQKCFNFQLQLLPARGQKSPSAAGTSQCGGALLFRFFCFGVSGRAFRRGWPHQRELPRCPAGRSASGGGSHAGRRRSLAGYLQCSRYPAAERARSASPSRWRWRD